MERGWKCQGSPYFLSNIDDLLRVVFRGLFSWRFTKASIYVFSLIYFYKFKSPDDFQDGIIIVQPLTGIVQTVANEYGFAVGLLFAIMDMPADGIGH